MSKRASCRPQCRCPQGGPGTGYDLWCDRDKVLSGGQHPFAVAEAYFVQGFPAGTHTLEMCLEVGPPVTSIGNSIMCLNCMKRAERLGRAPESHQTSRAVVACDGTAALD